jgi:hypothetical protein
LFFVFFFSSNRFKYKDAGSAVQRLKVTGITGHVAQRKTWAHRASMILTGARGASQLPVSGKQAKRKEAEGGHIIREGSYGSLGASHSH